MGEVTQYFQQETVHEILPKLKKYETQAKQYISEIIQYETTMNLYNKQEEWFLTSTQTKAEIIQAERNVYNKLADTRKQIVMDNQKIKNTIKNSYKLINNIGELFHEEIIYSITLPGSNGNITFEMPISQFLKNAVNISYTSGISLKDTSTLLNRLSQSRSQKIKKFDWNDQKNDFYNTVNYNNFLYEIRIAAAGGKIIKFNNEGTKLESFLHWVNEGWVNGGYTSQSIHHLGESAFNAMVNNLQNARDLGHNNKPYWSEGDVGNKQVKGAGADVTDTKSLKQQLLRFTTMTSLIDLNSLSKKLESTKNQVDDAGVKEVTKIINGLAHAFLHHWQFSQNDLKLMGLKISDLI